MCFICILLIKKNVQNFREEFFVDVLKNFSGATEGCALLNFRNSNALGGDGTSNYHIEMFKKKFYETFKDYKNFDRDIPNLRERFAIMITKILVSNHQDKTKLNLLGFTDAQMGARLFRQYLNELTKVQGDRTAKYMKDKWLFTDKQVEDFIFGKYKQDGRNVPVKDQREYKTVQEHRDIFKTIIVKDSVFGFEVLFKDLQTFMIQFFTLRESIEQAKERGDDDDAKKSGEDALDALEKMVKTRYDDHDGAGLIFKTWDKSNDSYFNKNRMKYNISQTFFHQIMYPIANDMTNDIVEICDYSHYYPKKIVTRLNKDDIVDYDYDVKYSELLTLIDES